ncbi:TatD family hydrolase [Bacillus songklensis]|uniref:TatD family hydrolase n=1 Tax=Bacillus songklensis TaxID=1069116 RepID=A0ABV8B216_9BACI
MFVCYRERDETLVHHVPLDKLLVETDGPWPFSGLFQHVKTSPLLLQEVTKKIASLKRMPLEEVIQQLNVNTISLYSG